MRILIAEDDPNIAESVRRVLVENHYVADVTADGEGAEELGFCNDYDAILLDIMLPKKSGLEVCAALRREGIATPIMMMTALGEDRDVITGLDSGADDYIVKPFHLGVLLARLRSLTRRNSDQKSAVIAVGDLRLDTSSRTVTRGGRPIELTAKEFILLEYFVMNRGRLLTREMISEHVWDMNFDPRSNVVDSLVRFLRRKIDNDFDHPLIATVRGAGYRFDSTSGSIE